MVSGERPPLRERTGGEPAEPLATPLEGRVPFHVLQAQEGAAQSASRIDFIRS